MTPNHAMLGVMALVAAGAACKPRVSLEPPPPVTLTLPVQPDTVLAVGSAVLEGFGWIVARDEDERTIRAHHVGANDANLRWMTCPPEYVWWGPGVSHSTVAARVEARLSAAGTSVLIAAEVLRAFAYDRYLRETSLVKCVSSGEIERVLADSLRRRFR